LARILDIIIRQAYDNPIAFPVLVATMYGYGQTPYVAVLTPYGYMAVPVQHRAQPAVTSWIETDEETAAYNRRWGHAQAAPRNDLPAQRAPETRRPSPPAPKPKPGDTVRRYGTFHLYHQTSPEAAASIIGSQTMLTGKGGWAGPGVYFAATPEETNKKALSKGVILRASVELGKMWVLSSTTKGPYSSLSHITGATVWDEGYDSVCLPEPWTGYEYVLYATFKNRGKSTTQRYISNISVFDPVKDSRVPVYANVALMPALPPRASGVLYGQWRLPGDQYSAILGDPYLTLSIQYPLRMMIAAAFAVSLPRVVILCLGIGSLVVQFKIVDSVEGDHLAVPSTLSMQQRSTADIHAEPALRGLLTNVPDAKVSAAFPAAADALRDFLRLPDVGAAVASATAERLVQSHRDVAASLGREWEDDRRLLRSTVAFGLSFVTYVDDQLEQHAVRALEAFNRQVILMKADATFAAFSQEAVPATYADVVRRSRGA
jgi:hypothetical protein